MINKRGEYIEDSLKAADEANERLKNIQVAGEKILTEAKNEQVNILREATNIKEQVIADAKNLAQIEADKLMANAHASIEQERKNAISDIRSQVTELSISVAEKILRKELTDRKADIELIDKLLNEVDIYKL
ncbi:ATP synthase subunit b [Bacteroidia bacterium]|nr:ATP synthase subunit b [Bacteroidia bacterium]